MTPQAAVVNYHTARTLALAALPLVQDVPLITEALFTDGSQSGLGLQLANGCSVAVYADDDRSVTAELRSGGAGLTVQRVVLHAHQDALHRDFRNVNHQVAAATIAALVRVGASL